HPLTEAAMTFIANRRFAILVWTSLTAFALSPALGFAQTASTDPSKDQTQARDVTAPALTRGYADFGARGTSFTGADSARYERYRDLSDGAFMRALRATRERGNWVFDVGADNAGRRDQRYTGTVTRPGKLTIWGRWDQIPMLIS